MVDLRERLDRQRCVFLTAAGKREAIEELVGHLCRSVPELPYRKIVDEVLSREEQLSTRLTADLALPHAQLDELDRNYIAIGRSLTGVAWETAEHKGSVPLVILLVGGKRRHLEVLSALAQLLEKQEVIDRLLEARDTAGLYVALAAPGQKDQTAAAVNRSMANIFRSAVGLAGRLKAAALLIHLPPDRLPAKLLAEAEGLNVVFITDQSSATTGGAYRVLSVPFKDTDRDGAVEVSLLLALTQGIVKKNDTVVSLFGRSDAGRIDSLAVTEMSRDYDHFLSIPIFTQDHDIQLEVFLSLLELIRELAREGREGKPVGALFVLGDHWNVSRYCQQMVINPFKGYDEAERNILDPSIVETLKEFSRIDGAMVIRGDGVIVSAGTYLRPDRPAARLPSGLGARHAAAAGITAVTNAVSFALSESTRQISLFHGGERIMVL
ncbi:MAG: diadenylate cyclase [Spirochaetales bacterium]|nr:diadenylate cyclase [Spirochaetales bacterium]